VRPNRRLEADNAIATSSHLVAAGIKAGLLTGLNVPAFEIAAISGDLDRFNSKIKTSQNPVLYITPYGIS